MTHPSPDKVYKNLERLANADTVHGATYRQDAVEVLADLDVNVDIRQAISERLEQVNHLLVLKNVDADDSY